MAVNADQLADELKQYAQHIDPKDVTPEGTLYLGSSSWHAVEDLKSGQ